MAWMLWAFCFSLCTNLYFIQADGENVSKEIFTSFEIYRSAFQCGPIGAGLPDSPCFCFILQARIWMAVSSFLHCFIIPSARTISVPSPLSTEAPGAALSVPKAYFLEGITAGAIIRLSACVAFLSLDVRFIKALGIVSLCCAPRGGAP